MQPFICSRQEIESLLVNWSGPDLSGFGELVLEGSFKVHRVKKERAFFLFDKMLLISKKRLEQFVYSTHIFVRASDRSVKQDQKKIFCSGPDWMH